MIGLHTVNFATIIYFIAAVVFVIATIIVLVVELNSGWIYGGPRVTKVRRHKQLKDIFVTFIGAE